MPVKIIPRYAESVRFTFAQLSSPARVPYQLKTGETNMLDRDGPETSRFAKDVEFSEE